jgi:hypothetical protein
MQEKEIIPEGWKLNQAGWKEMTEGWKMSRRMENRMTRAWEEQRRNWKGLEPRDDQDAEIYGVKVYSPPLETRI